MRCDKTTSVSVGATPVSARCRGFAALPYRTYAILLLTAVVVFMLAGCAPPESGRAKLVPRADHVIVEKAKRKLRLVQNGKTIREYRVALGERPWGHKVEEGDERTPEGDYFLDWRNPDSNYYKAIHISYPDRWDIQRARARGKKPGGMIMIHGQPEYIHSPEFKERYLSRDWTNGCIAVQNHEMDEIWRLVRDGTPITILP